MTSLRTPSCLPSRVGEREAAGQATALTYSKAAFLSCGSSDAMKIELLKGKGCSFKTFLKAASHLVLLGGCLERSVRAVQKAVVTVSAQVPWAKKGPI